MAKVKLGVLVWPQGSDWRSLLDAAQTVDRLGYDSLWTWDHIYAIVGDPYQDIFEGWTVLTAWAMATQHVELGLMVGANTFRNPGLTAKLAASLDHVSGGRAILGLGAAWFETEHEAHGIEFGSGFGQRLDWMDEAVAACRDLLDGKTVTSPPGGHYAFKELRHHPLPLRKHLPIMVGGGGEKKTLRSVARYADACNIGGTAETLRHKDEVLRAHCQEVGRDQSQIERTCDVTIVIRDRKEDAERAFAEMMAHARQPREEWDGPEFLWMGPPEVIAQEMRDRMDVGFSSFVVAAPTPWDRETVERLIGEVKPLVEA